ncbi:hypothetical protein Vafri_6587, partial [Volvox africanus]
KSKGSRSPWGDGSGAALRPSGDGPDALALAAGGGGGCTASPGQTASARTTVSTADTDAAIDMEVDAMPTAAEVRPHGGVQQDENPDLDLDGGLNCCSWPGLLAVQVFSWREAEGDVDNDDGDEADGGIAPGSAPSGDAAAAVGAAGTAMAASSSEQVAWPTGDALGSSAVAALPDLESLPPLKAATAVLTAVERTCCSSGGADGAAQRATTEADVERRVAVLQKLCGAQAQLLWLLFGVDFPWRDRSWGFGLPTAVAAAETAAAEGASDTPFVPGVDDARLLWRIVGPHAVLLAAPPEVPGLSGEARAALDAGFAAQLGGLLPTLDFLASSLPAMSEALVTTSCAHCYLHSPLQDNLTLACNPEAHLPEWLRPLPQPSQLRLMQAANTDAGEAPPPAPAPAPAATVAGAVTAAAGLGVAAVEGTATSSLQEQVPEFLAAEVRRQREVDPLWEIHRWLYFCILRARGLDQDPLQVRLQPHRAGGGGGAVSAPSATTVAASLLCADSDSSAELEADAAVALYDLALNPTRLQSWGAMQALYTDAVRRLLNEAALNLEVGAFRVQQQHQQSQHQQPSLSQPLPGPSPAQQQQPEVLAERALKQLAKLWRMAVRSATAAIRLDPDPESRAFRLEQLAVLHYDMIAPYHPLYDVWAVVNSPVVTARASPAAAAAAAVEADDRGAAGAGVLVVLSTAAVPPPEALQYGTTSNDVDELWYNSHRMPYMAFVRRDWRYQAACVVATDMWTRAAKVLSGEWQHEYFLGLVQA